jgi:hypothetical protein
MTDDSLRGKVLTAPEVVAFRGKMQRKCHAVFLEDEDGKRWFVHIFGPGLARAVEARGIGAEVELHGLKIPALGIFNAKRLTRTAADPARPPLRLKLRMRGKLLGAPVAVPYRGRVESQIWAAPALCLDTDTKFVLHIFWWPIARDLAVRGEGAEFDARGKRHKATGIFDISALMADPNDPTSRFLRRPDWQPRPKPSKPLSIDNNLSETLPRVRNDQTEALTEDEAEGLRRFLRNA